MKVPHAYSGWYKLLNEYPPELVGFQRPRPKNFQKGRYQPLLEGDGDPLEDGIRLKEDKIYWRFNGRFVNCPIIYRAWPEAVRRRASQLYRGYGQDPPPELEFRGISRGKRWKDTYIPFWERVGGLPRHLANFLHERRIWPKIHYNKNLFMETQRVGVLEFLKRNPQAACKSDIQWWKFASGVWEALVLACSSAGIKLPAHCQSELMSGILYDPQQFAEAIKNTAAAARHLAMLGTLGPYDNLILYDRIGTWSAHQCLQFSMVARALPAPLFIEDLIPGYLKRLMEDRPIAFDPSLWLADYFRRFKPDKFEHRTFSLGSAACAELSRRSGGLVAACQPLIAIGKQYNDPNLFSALPLTSIMVAKVGQKWRWLITGALVVCEKLFKEEYIPLSIALLAPEKGLKTRIPTASIAPVLILQHVLRGYMDQVLERDPRVGPSITPGDPMRVDISPEYPNMGHRSVDATTATDLHPFEWTRSIYRELLKHLPQIPFFHRVGKLLDWLLGPREIEIRRVRPPGSTPFPSMYSKPFWEYMSCGKRLETYWNWLMSSCQEEKSPWTSQYRSRWAQWVDKAKNREVPIGPSGFQTRLDYLTGLNPVEEYPDHTQLSYPNMFDELISYYLTGVRGWLTSQGAMMGEPTSWVGLSLMNCWSWEQSAPEHLWYRLRTTGDDAEAFCSQEVSDNWTSALQKGGVVVSTHKDYFSMGTKFGVYTEIITNENGKPMGIYPLSTLVGPEGGSKGTESWATSPAHTVVVAARVGAQTPPKRLWKLSRFYPQWVAAAQLGIMLHVPERFGGINFPLNCGIRFSPKRGNLFRWATYLSTLSVEKYAAHKFGLALHSSPKFGPDLYEAIQTYVGSAMSSGADLKLCSEDRRSDLGAYKPPKQWPPMVLKTITDHFIKRMINNSSLTFVPPQFQGDNAARHLPFTDVVRSMLNVCCLDLILSGHRPPGGEKIPSVFKTSEKFLSTIHKVKPIPMKGSVQNLIKEIDKRSTRFLGPWDNKSEHGDFVTPVDVQRLFESEHQTALLLPTPAPFKGLVTRQ